MIYNVVLVSGVQKSDIYLFFFWELSFLFNTVSEVLERCHMINKNTKRFKYYKDKIEISYKWYDYLSGHSKKVTENN